MLEPLKSGVPHRPLVAAGDMAAGDTVVVDAPPEPSSRPAPRLIVRFVLGALALLGAVVLIVRTFRPELEALSRAFVAHFGVFGFTLGSFLADGFHFPVPPQFYMLLSLGAGTPKLIAFSAIAAGSLLGGAAGYAVALRLSRFPRLGRWLERTGRRFREQLEGRKAYRSAVIASLTPIAFSMQCYLSGLYRLPRRAFGLILLLRIPKLIFFYYLVQLGWSGL